MAVLLADRDVVVASPSGGACRDNLVAQLERPWWRLRFTGEWERRYRVDVAPVRRRLLIAGLVLGVVSFIGLSAGDARRLPEVAQSLFAIKTSSYSMTALVLAASLAGWWRGAPLPVWLLELDTVGAGLCMALYEHVQAGQVHDQLSVLKVSWLVLVPFYQAFVVRQPFPLVVGVGIASWTACVPFSAHATPFTALAQRGTLLWFSAGLGFALVTSYLLDRRERRGYLLRHADARRQAAMADVDEAVRRLSLEDALTGLANRRRWDAESDRLWRSAAQAAAPCSVLAVDVDLFKPYNDTYGHPAGDACLQQVAAVLLAVAAEQGALAARLGGEEFALLLPGCGPGAGAEVAEQVCERVRAAGLPHAASPVAPYVTVSVGVASTWPAAGGSPAHLTAAADAALYQVKSAGRDGWALAQEVEHDDVVLPAVAPDVQLEPTRGVIADLTGLLGQPLYRLAFPAALERLYDRPDPRERRLELVMTAWAGFAAMLLYEWCLRPLYADVAAGVLTVQVLLSLPGLLTVTLLLHGFGRWTSRAVVAASTVGLELVFVATVSRSESANLLPGLLSVVLVTAFLSVFVEVPVRTNAMAAAVLLIGWAGFTVPGDGEGLVAWAFAVEVVVIGMLFGLIAGYRLELERRRAFLLDRLAGAQLAALEASTRHRQRLATVDPLTGLVNRRQFEVEQARCWAECSQAGLPLALLILDVDNFKAYNDTYGHAAGDDCLRRVAAVLLTFASDHGLAANSGRADPPVAVRLGGEEFAVLLPGRSLDEALVLAERLRADVKELCIQHSRAAVDGIVTTSVGAASRWPTRTADTRALLVDADAALYRAKNAGRDRVAG